MCGQPGSHVDHIERGQNHAMTNLRTLCEHCHMVRTGRDGGTAPRRPRRHHRPPEPHPGRLT
ncbi:HNH endonuclease signature motif containing protein [Actinomyces urogenitalis]